MNFRNNTWARVLAAGDGARLARLTTDQWGHSVPTPSAAVARDGTGGSGTAEVARD